MRALHHSVNLKHKHLRKAKPAVLKVDGRFLNRGHESWIVTDKVQTQTSESKRIFLQKIRRIVQFLTKFATLQFEILSTGAANFAY